MEEFPSVQGGGSLLLAWQVRNRKVLVIGGGNVNTHSFSFRPRIIIYTHF